MNSSLEIIATLCDKLGRLFFSPIQLSFANLLCSVILRNATVMVMFT